jgi:hypothetical protein
MGGTTHFATSLRNKKGQSLHYHRRSSGENAVGDRIHQEAAAFFEEFGTKLEGVMPRGSKSQKRSENGSGGGYTRRKDWYRLNDVRTTACGRDMDIWVPKLGSAPVPDLIETVWEAWR